MTTRHSRAWGQSHRTTGNPSERGPEPISTTLRTPCHPPPPQRALLLLWIVAVGLALVGLGNVPLRDWDEALVARVSLELSRSPGMGGLLPTYLGEPYLNKPPGLHLAIAAAIRFWAWVRGDLSPNLPPEWLVRLVPALASTLLVPLLGLVQARLRPGRADAAIATALIALTLLPLARHGRLAMLDGSQLTAMALVWLGLLSAESLRGRVFRGGLMAGLGGSFLLLLKAPVAPPVLAMALWLRQRDRVLDARAWRWLLAGLALGLVPGLAWHGWHLAARGSGALVMWGPQGMDRLIKVVNGNGGGPLIPLTQALIGGWPWLPLLPCAVWRAWQERHRPAGRWVLGLGLMAILLVFPLRTQLPWYSLLLWPPFCLACGPVLADLAAGSRKQGRRRSLGTLWLAIGGLLLAAAVGSALLPGQPLPLRGSLSAAPAAMGLAVGGWQWRRGTGRWGHRGAVAALAAGWVLSLGCLFAGPFWNWELANAPPIAPALGLATAGPGSSRLMLLERDAESQRPSLRWYLDSAAAPLAEEPQLWPAERFRLVARLSPESQSKGGRCRIEQAASAGWKRWECRPRRSQS